MGQKPLLRNFSSRLLASWSAEWALANATFLQQFSGALFEVSHQGGIIVPFADHSVEELAFRAVICLEGWLIGAIIILGDQGVVVIDLGALGLLQT